MVEDVLLGEILQVIAKASVGELETRVKISEHADMTNPVNIIAAALNVLLEDLESNQEKRIRRLAEEAILRSEESAKVITRATELLKKFDHDGSI